MERLTIERNFTYHPPQPEQVARYNRLRDATKELAHLYSVNAPASPELTLAIRKLQEAVMWANAAIACNEL